MNNNRSIHFIFLYHTKGLIVAEEWQMECMCAATRQTAAQNMKQMKHKRKLSSIEFNIVECIRQNAHMHPTSAMTSQVRVAMNGETTGKSESKKPQDSLIKE